MYHIGIWATKGVSRTQITRILKIFIFQAKEHALVVCVHLKGKDMWRLKVIFHVFHYFL